MANKKKISDINPAHDQKDAAEAPKNSGKSGKNNKKPQGMTPKKGIGLVLSALLLIAAGYVAWVWFFHVPEVVDPGDTRPIIGGDINDEHPNGVDPTINQDNTGKTDPTAAPVKSSRKTNFFNILVIGRDAASASTDVIMLVSFDVPNNSVAVMQIPRDTYIKTDRAAKRINAQFAPAYNAALKLGKSKDSAVENGINAVINTVSRTFGVPIDRYIYMDLTGFKKIVDIVGGVDVDVQFNMKYDDPEQGLHINLKKGLQTLNGDKAEQFIRFRKNNDGTGYAGADIDRIKAQKQFLTALSKKMKASSLTQLAQMAEAGMKNVKTDCTLPNFKYFIENGLKVDLEKITFVTLPGEGKTINGAAMYAPYASESIKLINDYFNPLKQDITKETSDFATLETHQNVPVDTRTAAEIEKDPPKGAIVKY